MADKANSLYSEVRLVNKIEKQTSNLAKIKEGKLPTVRLLTPNGRVAFVKAKTSLGEVADRQGLIDQLNALAGHDVEAAIESQRDEVKNSIVTEDRKIELYASIEKSRITLKKMLADCKKLAEDKSLFNVGEVLAPVAPAKAARKAIAVPA